MDKTNDKICYFSNISIQRYHIDEFKEKAANCCIRFGHSLWSAVNCQRKRLTSNRHNRLKKEKLL